MQQRPVGADAAGCWQIAGPCVTRMSMLSTGVLLQQSPIRPNNRHILGEWKRQLPRMACRRPSSAGLHRACRPGGNCSGACTEKSASTAAWALAWPRKFSEILSIRRIAGISHDQAQPPARSFAQRQPSNDPRRKGLSGSEVFATEPVPLPGPAMLCLDLGSRRFGLERTPLRSSAAIADHCQFQTASNLPGLLPRVCSSRSSSSK